MMRGEEKISRSHLERAALVYLRQSTLAQVREHGESTARQYGLVGEAARLGWPAARIEVIDCDLGLSGRTATHREGFRELLGRVCAGEAGAVFGLEVSRLARSNADLSRLLEIARITDTLVIDADGVYDLADINDRLLLGLKSQLSEAELHLLHTRLDGARRAAAARGELRLPLPAGYVYDEAGQVVKDPDEEIQAAISDVFAAFTAAGSAYGVAAAFAGRRFPGRAGPDGSPSWGRLSYGRVVGLLHNPVYAGAYVFGRHRTRQHVDAGGTVRSRTRAVARGQWQVLIRDHHQGYITWEEYLAIEARMAAGQTSGGARPPREGGALCQGIIYCGCGRHMGVHYQESRAYYKCRARSDRQATPGCQHASAAVVDAAVTGALFTAIAPAELELAIAATGEVTARRQRAARAAGLAVERARYQADRAGRAFLACEPENRLVARTLEARWEARLAELAGTEAAGKLGVSRQTIKYWIDHGYLTARRGPAGLWAIPFPPEVEAACRQRAASSIHQHKDIVRQVDLVDRRRRDAHAHLPVAWFRHGCVGDFYDLWTAEAADDNGTHVPTVSRVGRRVKTALASAYGTSEDLWLRRQRHSAANPHAGITTRTCPSARGTSCSLC
jgi:DNA invertase Pin-like site-specific DNA recombinase